MKNKLISLIIAASLFAGGILSERLVTAVRAGSWDGLVYSINGTSGDSDGNVNVSTVNGHTINSDVPASANFAQYDQNTADIATIENALSGLTATAEDVAYEESFIGSDGTKQIGTMGKEITYVESAYRIGSAGYTSTITRNDNQFVIWRTINNHYDSQTSLIQGSNDNSTWINIPNSSNTSSTPEYGINNSYKYYRGYCSGHNSPPLLILVQNGCFAECPENAICEVGGCVAVWKW